MINPVPLVAAALVIAGTTGCGTPVEAAFALSTSADGVTALRIDWKHGAVKVRVDENEQEITATGTKVVYVSNESRAAAALENLGVAFRRVDDDPAKLLLTMQPGRKHPGTNFRGDVDIVLPRAIALNIRIGNGTAQLSGNAAPSTVDLGNGEVEITMQSGDTAVRVRRGTINVDSLAGTVDARCGTGEIDVTARPVQGDRLVASVGTGAIDLRVPVETAAQLDLRAFLGEVDATLSDFTVTDGTVRLTSVNATINGGGAYITADAGIGAVVFGRN